MKLLALSSVFVLLAGCAGSTAAPVPANAPGAAPMQAQAFAATGVRRKGTLTVRIRIPRKRRAHYISAATKGMTMAFAGPSTSTQVVNLTPSDPRCKGTPLTCTIAITLLAGNYTVTINTYDRAPSGGSIPASANLLSTAKNVAFTMTGGITNAVGITLDGVPASLVVGGLPSGSIGTPFATPQPFTVTAKDADGDTIVGTYENPVTVGNSDTSGATTVATSGSDSPRPGRLLSSSDTVTLNYTGVTLTSATIHATAIGANSGTGTFTPSTPPAPTLTKSSAASIAAGATNFSVTLTGTNFSTLGTTVAVSGSGMTESSVHVVGPTSLTVDLSVTGGAAFGPRNVTVTTPGGTSGPVPVTVYTGRNYTVNVFTDNAPGSTPGTCPAGNGTGVAGDLRFAMCNAAPGDAIIFDCISASCTITLAAPLPPITENLVIDGGTFGDVTIDGNGAYRAFFVDTGTVTLANLQVQNALAQGGAGGKILAGNSGSAGGGGAGLGGGLFVNQAGATVTLVGDYFVNDAAVGGAGGAGSAAGSSGSSAGGGGLGGAGGSGVRGNPIGGSGGGGVLGAGQTPTTGVGAAGGLGGGGGGGGLGTGVLGGAGGSGYAGNAAGSPGGTGTAGVGGAGGAGGFGGGGGSVFGAANPGGAGGFGGGGGGGFSGGAGGAGGGGGGTLLFSAGAGGGLSLSVSGGSGDTASNGGGGAAAGPAIFVNAGALATSNSGATGASATGGTKGGGSAMAGSADSTPVFNYGGTVNGSATTGPVASALSGSAPAARHRRLAPRQKMPIPSGPLKPVP